MISDRNSQILAAASELFMRYGIGRVTMAEIAKTAGVARQTLYNAYPNKEEVMRAVVRAAGEAEVERVQAAWTEQDNLPDRIETFLTSCPLAWYDLVASSPDAAELVDGLNSTAKAEVGAAMTAWRRIFSRQFSEAGAEDPDGLADFFMSSAKSAKFDAPDREAVVKRLAMLKSAVLAMLPDQN